ncbi:DnaD domain protein [Parageobacillus toebii]|uniref:DnaD domain protein n=1 Tax=Parageobacillus toebii TaxID=153151 RepID=UPI002E1AEC97|nr:DnaD domain protein [Parageobacillus toebii]
MGVIRVQKNSNYVVMNKTALHDPRLSWKAKGLHAYMLSMPDDWKFYDDELEKHAKDGKDALKSAIKELKQYGYMRRERRQNEQGKFEWETIVYEEPYTENPSMEKPSMENPSMENPQLLNNKELNNNLLNNKEINDDDIGKPNPFLEFEQAFGYRPPAILEQEFKDLIDKSQFVEPEAIICEAIKRAKLQMPRNPASYVSKILKDLHYLGLFTLDAVREYNEKFDKQTKRRVGKAKVSEIDWEAL